jgi:hypothetical protein
MDARKAYALVFALIVVGGGICAYLLAYGVPQQSKRPAGAIVPGADSGIYFFGNNATGDTGWEMPSETLVSTSVTITSAIDAGFDLSLAVFPYNTAPNTILYLGVYANGVLIANNNASVSARISPPASIIGASTNTAAGPTANFTNDVNYFSIGFLAAHALPKGTTLTLTAYSTSPIWVQTASSASQTGSSSYETASSTPVPSTLPANQGSATPSPVFVSGEASK